MYKLCHFVNVTKGQSDNSAWESFFSEPQKELVVGLVSPST